MQNKNDEQVQKWQGSDCRQTGELTLCVHEAQTHRDREGSWMGTDGGGAEREGRRAREQVIEEG